MEDRPPDAPDPVSPSASWTPPPPPTQPPPPTGPPGRAVIPWEEPGRPWISGLIETIKLLFTSPRAAFERMPVSGDVLRPFLFAILVGWTGAVFGVTWNLLFSGIMPRSPEYERYSMPNTWAPFFALFAPLIIVVSLLIGTAINHLFLMILGGARRGIAATLRVLCYASVPQILNVIPGCGSLLGGVGTLVLTVIGLSAVHGISIGKSVLAVILPTLLCCICGIALLFTVGAGLMARYGMGQ
jgi:hypothetical protein